jgi:hypothetical protein
MGQKNKAPDLSTVPKDYFSETFRLPSRVFQITS